jgi:phytanoyl-CoA hydroxylase
MHNGTTTGLRSRDSAWHGCLTDQQVRFFRDTGYLRFPQTLSQHEVMGVRAAVMEQLDRAVEPVRRDSAGRVVRLSRLSERGPIFRQTFASPRLLGPLASLLGPNIVFVRNRHNHATLTAALTKSARLHRDVLQWSRPIVTVLVYLDAATEQSGCTRIIPASHLLPFVGTPNNGGTWMDEHHVFADLLEQAIPVPMPAGGVLAVDGLAFHAAGHTTGSIPRVALTGAYRSVDELARDEPADPNLEVLLGENLYRGDS